MTGCFFKKSINRVNQIGFLLESEQSSVQKAYPLMSDTPGAILAHSSLSISMSRLQWTGSQCEIGSHCQTLEYSLIYAMSLTLTPI
jgi:hypothetical protein